MIFLIIVGALVAGAGTAYVASDDVRYVTRAGLEETRILQARESIARLVADSATPSDLRASLRLVLAVRDYADSLGLDAGDTYTTYADVGRDTLLLVLQAAPPDCICPYTWKWPIVGRMPYKGFFEAEAAEREAAQLAGRGYDIYLRPSGAFSTLGWFEDPLLSTALSADSMELAATVFHEIAHNSLYIASATPFNESFAQLVGYRSAERFFRERGDTLDARRAADRWHDEILLGGFYTELKARLDGFYATHPDSAALDSGRLAEGRWAKAQLEGLLRDSLRTYTIGSVPERPVNNARLIGATIYRSHLDWFESYFEQHGGDIEATVAGLKRLMDGAKGDEAFARLNAAVLAPLRR
ncbi:MAG TPA: aminopeptidase [Gemmatimonadales bacterium]|nr:aminopeptidase [Gemmatimonadales bacterium]